METQQTEGIILQNLPFKDYDSILTLFTPDEGILKIFLKGAFRQNKGLGSRAVPLTRVEVNFSRGRSELVSCHEIHVIDHHFDLRQNFALLSAGCEMIKAVLSTQQPGKAAADLYKLLRIYLKKLPDINSPSIMSASFALKVLRYEGLFAFTDLCSTCHSPLSERFLYAGETYCSRHAPPSALALCSEELQLLTFLAFCRDLTQLKELSLPPCLLTKAQELFKHSI